MLRVGELGLFLLCFAVIIWGSIFLGLKAWRYWKQGEKEDAKDDDARIDKNQ